MKMTDTSIDTLETSYDTTTVSQTTDTTLSEDDDDELLALRIAALESIKLQKSKASEKLLRPRRRKLINQLNSLLSSHIQNEAIF